MGAWVHYMHERSRRMGAWNMTIDQGGIHRCSALRRFSLVTPHSWPPNAELRDMTRKADQEKRTAEHVESSMQRCGVWTVESSMHR